MADDLFGLCGSDLADELFMSCLPLSFPVPLPDKPYGSYQTWCLTSTETIRLSRDGEKGGMEVGEERGGEFIPIATLIVATKMTPTLRWAVMRVILMFHLIVRDKVTGQCPQTTTFEEKGEPKRIRTRSLCLPA